MPLRPQRASTAGLRVLLLALAVSSQLRGQQINTARDGQVGRPLVLFVHGRDQEYKTTADLERTWYDAISDGISKLRDQDNIADLTLPLSDRRLVHYEYLYEKDFHPKCTPARSRALVAFAGALSARLDTLQTYALRASDGLSAANTRISHVASSSTDVFVRTDSSGFNLLVPAGIYSVSAAFSTTAADLANLSLQLRDSGQAVAASHYANAAMAIGEQRDSLNVAARKIAGIRLSARKENSGVLGREWYVLPDSAQRILSHAEATLRYAAPATFAKIRYDFAELPAANDVVPAPADWPGFSDAFKKWVASLLVKMGLGGVFARELEDVNKYLSNWSYQCATNAVIGDSLESARATRHPIVVVAHSLGTLITYSVLHARDVAAARDSMRINAFIALGSQLGISEVMQSLIGLSNPPFPYPSGIQAWTFIRGENDWLAPTSPSGRFEKSNGRSIVVLTTNTMPGDQHSIVGYLKNVDTAREIMRAWCGAFSRTAMATRPIGCKTLLAHATPAGTRPM